MSVVFLLDIRDYVEEKTLKNDRIIGTCDGATTVFTLPAGAQKIDWVNEDDLIVEINGSTLTSDQYDLLRNPDASAHALSIPQADHPSVIGENVIIKAGSTYYRYSPAQVPRPGRVVDMKDQRENGKLGYWTQQERPVNFFRLLIDRPGLVVSDVEYYLEKLHNSIDPDVIVADFIWYFQMKVWEEGRDAGVGDWNPAIPSAVWTRAIDRMWRKGDDMKPDPGFDLLVADAANRDPTAGVNPNEVIDFTVPEFKGLMFNRETETNDSGATW